MQSFNFEPIQPANIIYVIEQPIQIEIPDISFDHLLKNYCLWDVYKHSEIIEPKPRSVQLEPQKCGKKKCIEAIDFTSKIDLLSGIIGGIMNNWDSSVEKFIIISKRKPNTPRGKKFSKRRSQYIGVSRNGSSYQVLISVNGRKTYLGSFDNEHEAAVTFDFYSILLHSIEAKTNFSYTAFNILEMIQNYKVFKNLRNFYPSILENLQ